jgi:hypothetical protein
LAKAEEAKKKADEEAKKEEEEVAKLDALGKIQYFLTKKHEALAKDITDRLAVRRLTKAQKAELFATIRYAHLHHEELLETSRNPLFSDAKDLIMQGLSYRLSPYEQQQQ